MGGKKHDRKKKTKVVLSLGEFNEGAGIGGIDPDLAALPSAPKAAEDWEAEGGRPEYNSRGYKERKPYADRNYDADAEFEERDWVRKGPLDSEEGSFGMGGGDRDWSGMRRGPLDAPDGEQPERDWNGIRRGPVESAFEGASGERDWGTRKGPVEADLGKARVINDDNWGSARGNAVEAEFKDSAPAKDRDWGVRKGPVEAETAEAAQEADWTARKGPVESEFATQEASRDWTQRKGPVEAVAAKAEDADWGARKGPVEAEVPEKKQEVAERDWSARRGPVETEVEAAQKAVRDIDFGDVRRGARLQEMEEKEASAKKDLPRRPATADRWRRDSMGAARTGPFEPRERPASTGHDATPKPERDWGAARRTQPVPQMSRPNRGSTGRLSNASDGVEISRGSSREVVAEDKDDEWTTVRSAPNKRLSGSGGNRRFSGRGNLQEREGRSMGSSRDKATSSPVTPVASAVSES